MNRMHFRFLIGAALVGLLGVTPSAGSAQTTFTACRVPVVGVLYLLAAPADPCLDAAHVKFSWTDGGAPADGSITSAKIADGTIAAVDIANSSITSAKVDTNTIQARVSGSCAAGSSVSSVAVSGTVVCQSTGGDVAANQVPNFASSVAISSTTAVELLSLALPGSTSGAATIAAHAYVEKDATTTGRYEFSLRVGTCAGTIIGLTMWRPLTGSGFHAESIALTGAVSTATSATTVVFCGRQFDSPIPPGTAYARGIVANW